MTESRETNLMSAAMCCLLIVALVGMAGCTTAPKAAEDVMKAGLMDGAVQAAKAPLFKLTCPPTGCMLGSLEIGNPGAAAQMAEVVKIAMTPQVSESSANFRAVLGAVTQVGGYGVIGHFATKAISSVTDGFKAGYASNASISGAGFDSNAKIAALIPQPAPVATVPLPTNQTIVTGNTGPVNLGGTQLNNSQNPVNPSPRVCGITYSATGIPNGFNCVGG